MAEHLLQKYYFDQQCPCSTVILRTAKDLGWIKCSQDNLYLMECFCKTYQSDGVCGSYTGALAVLHLYFVDHPAQSVFVEDISESLREMFQGKFRTVRCSEIKLSQSRRDVKCLNVFRTSIEIMEEMIKHLRVDSYRRSPIQQYYKEINYV